MAISGTTVAIIAAVAAASAAATAAYASYESGQQQAKVAKVMAKQEEFRAQAARDAAAVQEAQARQRNARIRANARARAEASGIASDEGSPLLIELENARQSKLEENLILYGGDVQQQFLQQESRLINFKGHQAKRAGNTGAGLTLLSGVANAASAYAGAPRSTSPGAGSYSTSPGYQSQRAGERASY